MRILFALSSLLILIPLSASSQVNVTPTVASVMNAASYAQPVAPGELVTIKGSHLTLGQTAQASADPLPTQLGGTTVLIGGVPAALLYVSPEQINAQVPTAIFGSQDFSYNVSATVLTSAGVSTPMDVPLSAVSPGFFTSNASGCGPVAALNITPDGDVSVNSKSNSAAPGDFIALFGTGLGVPTVVHPNGVAPTEAEAFMWPGAIHWDYASSPVTPSYAGLAPNLVGVDQVNFQVPLNSREGCSIPITMDTGELTRTSQLVSVSVSTGRGQCTDPPEQSYGTVSLEKTVLSSSTDTSTTEQFLASFPAAPGLVQPALPTYNLPTAMFTFWVPAASARACLADGYHRLSAGTISLQAGSNPVITVDPMMESAGTTYSQSLPANFIHQGTYELSSNPGTSEEVAFQASVPVGEEINIQNTLTPGTELSPYTTRTLTWTGGDASSIVRATLIQDVTKTASPRSVWYASAAAGFISLPSCSGGGGSGRMVCSYGLPGSLKGRAKLIVDVLPADGAALFQQHVPGISEELRFSWAYHYVFEGLTLTF